MKLIKLLLTENVDNLGIVGDVVNVRPGYARNFLMPRRMATNPSEGNIKRLAERRKQVEQELRLKRGEQEEMIQKLVGHELTMMRSANEQGVLFGGVSQHDIAEALRGEGFAVEDRHVRVGEQIKRLDSYAIPIVIASDLRTEVKLWVVSDKPAEELDAEAAPAAAAAEESPAEDAEKPKRSKKERAKAEASAEGESAPAEEKPEGKKKSRKQREDEA